MNAVFHRYAALLQHISQLAHGMLSLRRRKTITRHKYHLAGIGQLNRDVVDTHFAHAAVLITTWACRRGSTAESAEQNVSHRAIHRATHQDRQYETRKTIECTRDDQNVIR